MQNICNKFPIFFLQVDDKCEFAYETIGQIEIQRDNMEAAVKAFDKVKKTV